MQNFLLPEGFRDSLPELAEKEYLIVNSFLNFITNNGFEVVIPPLLEFENSFSLLSKKQINKNSFRLLDPLSQKMMALRSDITSQIARIASSSLTKKNKPLRLCYVGEILKVKSDQLNVSRQSTQIGAEIIDYKDSNFEIEIIILTISLLKLMKINDFSLIFSMPSIFDAIIKDFKLKGSQVTNLKEKLSNKNLTEIQSFPKKLFDISSVLLKNEGDFKNKIKELSNFKFSRFTQIEINKFLETLKLIDRKLKNIDMNIDPVEIDKSGYHNGIMFKFYSKNLTDLFSGGCYKIEDKKCIGFSGLIENMMKESNIILKKKKGF
tara:strand:- start:997 stop:1962 length:966 start_codon:yes stop_codon:yes gene_type:complete